MSVRRGLVRGVAALSAGQVAAQGLSMVKNVVVARLLGPEDWGVALTFWMALTLLDAVSTVAADRQVVQAEDGRDATFLGTAHALQALRGLGIGLVVFGMSWVAAWAFDTRQALWAYQMIALVPVLRGFSHLGMYAQQRELRFAATIRVEVWTQLIALGLGIWLAWELRSYAAALWLALGQTAASCVLSHVVGGSRYGWSWDREKVWRMVRFGLPLMGNGVLLFVILEGDQGVIGVRYDKETLGLYGAAFALASIPTMLAAKVASTALLPPLAQAQADDEAFSRRVGASVAALALVGGAAGIGMAVLGPWAVTTLFGREYGGAEAVVGLLGLMFALRIVRIGPTLAAMARGDTMNSMVSNLWRSVALGGVLCAAALRLPVWWIALAGVAGEAAALLASGLRLRRRQRVSLRTSVWASVVAMVVAGGALGVERWVGPLGLGMGLAAGAATGLGLVVVMAAMFPRVSSELGGLVRAARRAGARAGGGVRA